MQITITGHNIEVTPTLREYAKTKVSKVRKFLNNSIKAHIILKVENQTQIAEVSIHANGVDLHCTHKDTNMYAALDTVMDKIDRQAKKIKGKTDAKRKSGDSIKTGSVI